ncbi:MAG: hypothetical protein ACRC50_06975 [Gaiella sp.]
MGRIGRVVALALVVGLTAVAAGCGSDDASDPTAAWADSACTALSDWRTSVEDAVTTVTDSPSLDGLSTAADDVVASTSALRQELTDLGAPPTDAQGQTQDALDTLTTSLTDRAEAVQAAISSADSLSEIASAVAEISTQVQGAVADVQTFLSDAADPDSAADEVVTALEQSDACSALRG